MDALEPRNLAPDLPPRLKQKLRWQWNRLRCMTPLEVGHRVLRLVQARAERSGLIGAREVPRAYVDFAPAPWIHRAPGIDPAPYAAAADRIAEGWLNVFALRDVDLGSPPRWNRDPKTGIEAPLVFGKLLDYRDPDLVGDIKYLWEPNRHGHLVTLAQAFALTGEDKYFRVVQEHLDSWLIACPYGMGANWASSLEAAMRLANWSAAWQLLGVGILEKHPERCFRIPMPGDVRSLNLANAVSVVLYEGLRKLGIPGEPEKTAPRRGRSRRPRRKKSG